MDEIRISHAWNILNLNQGMITFADKKMHALFIISTIYSTLFLTQVDLYLSLRSYQKILLSLYIVSFLLFIIFGLLCLFARKDESTGNTVDKLIYYGHVATRREAIEYTTNLLKTKNEEILKDIGYQIFELSKIAKKKFKYYNYSWIALIIQTLLVFTFIFSKIW